MGRKLRKTNKSRQRKNRLDISPYHHHDDTTGCSSCQILYSMYSEENKTPNSQKSIIQKTNDVLRKKKKGIDKNATHSKDISNNQKASNSLKENNNQNTGEPSICECSKHNLHHPWSPYPLNRNEEDYLGFGNTFRHFTGQTPFMGSINLLYYLGIFLISLTIAYLCIIIFMPLLASIDRGLLFGFGGLVQDFMVSIIFLIVLILGITTVLCGFSVFYSLLDFNGFTAIFFKNIAILLCLGLLTTAIASNTKQSDAGTIQIIYIYFYLLVTVAAVIALLGIVNSLPKLFFDMLGTTGSKKAITQNFLVLVISLFAILGPIIFSSGIIQTTTITEGYIVSVISNSESIQTDIQPNTVAENFRIENVIFTSLRQNTSTTLSFNLKSESDLEKQNKNYQVKISENELQENIVALITTEGVVINGERNSSTNTIPIRIHPTLFSDSSWFLTSSFIIPTFKGKSMIMDITIPFSQILYGSIYQNSVIHLIIAITTYQMVDPDAGYYYLKDVGRLFGVYTLKTTNFLVIVIGTIGLLMTFATLIKQFSMIQNYFGNQFLQDRYNLIFQPLLPLIVALVLLTTVLNSAYINTIQKFLLF